MTASLDPGPNLAALLKGCEVECVAACCGLEAFDFSALVMAKHLQSHAPSSPQNEADSISSDLQELARRGRNLSPDAAGFICSIEGTNQMFTRPELKDLILKLQKNLALAAQRVS